MKKILIIALAVLASASFNTASAGKKKDKKSKETPAAAVTPVQLKSSTDSVSYAAGMVFTGGLTSYLQQQLGVDTAYMADVIRGFQDAVKASADPKAKAYIAGMQIADQVQGRMLTSLKKDFSGTPDSITDATLFRGFTDALQKDTTVFTLKKAESVFQELHGRNKAFKDEAAKAAGRAFLTENAKKEGVITTPSGLQYKVLVKGEGAVPTKTDKVQVHYEGRLIDGTVFDASRRHGDKPSTFRADQVIKGWTEALTMMPVGSKWQLFIPQELAYGSRDQGQIKPYSTLIFDVELLGIEK